MNTNEKLLQAEFFRRNNRTEEAMRLANEVLNDEPEQPEALYIAAVCLLESGKHGLSYPLWRRFLENKPNVPQAWNNLGRCLEDFQKSEEADRCFRRAVRLNPEDHIALHNMGLMQLRASNPEKAIEFVEKALALAPDFETAKFTLGMAQLMLRQWVPGWENYEASAGVNEDRNERVYANESRWDGSKGKKVVIFGEQGIGDEINFASCLPDAIKDCREVIVECDKRLEGLFKRSFPEAKVFGTRYLPMIDWGDHIQDLDARLPMASLMKFYRTTDESYPGTPYLVADPERRLQWRALLDSLGPKLKVGIAWVGGKNKTGKKWRSLTLEALEPVLRQDATFISLQYKDPTDEIAQFKEKTGVHIHHWPRAVEARDYDETAALVAELDVVVSVTTAAIHLSGALGKECMVLVPTMPTWRYGLTGEKLPFYNSVSLIRQTKHNNWLDPIHEVAYRLRDKVNGHHKLCDAGERGRIAA